ncbi:MAG TPA: rRNA adenine N-6-methyltransferase family protein, partial [Pseudorhizobium sp.]|nr:rRNA adenine N-6-methyltransferase family protein [Pseudorhizobium sp.]
MRLKEKLGRRFDEEIRFFKGWIDGPKSVGAILPTSSITARRMASVIEPSSGLPVLELGPGTGIITKAILERGVAAQNIVSIEYSTDFFQHLTRTIP